MSFVKKVAIFTTGYLQKIPLNSMVAILGIKQQASFFQEIINLLLAEVHRRDRAGATISSSLFHSVLSIRIIAVFALFPLHVIVHTVKQDLNLFIPVGLYIAFSFGSTISQNQIHIKMC